MSYEHIQEAARDTGQMEANSILADEPCLPCEGTPNLALFFDSETSGLPDYKQPSSAAHQPHIVQLAALLVDLDTRNIISSMDVIVRPDGWEIDDEALALHGITAAHAMAVGVPESVAVEMFMAMWNNRLRIAHNQTFDARIIRIALMRFKDVETADFWKAGAAECTGQLSRPLCKLPKNKMPKLSEAYQHFTGAELVGAHSAMADTKACMEVYFSSKAAKVVA